MGILDGIRPGLNYVLIRHDSDCPTVLSQRMSDCVCQPRVEVSQRDEDFVDALVQTRQQRRAAERAAEKAMRKAQRGAK